MLEERLNNKKEALLEKELVYEEVVSLERYVLLLGKDFLVAALHKMGLKRDGNLNVDV